jgi:L-asparaginase
MRVEKQVQISEIRSQTVLVCAGSPRFQALHCRAEYMQTIYLITTGGTIEKEYSERSGAVLNTSNKIGQYLGLLRLPECDVRVIPLMNKDSLEMSADDRALLVEEVKKLLPQNCPVVITHGTDTMVESGRAIEDAIPVPAVPIVLTGAMAPLGFERSDGLQNLTESLFAARLLAPGVYVVLHNQAFPVSEVRKDRARSTFVRA